MKLYSILTSTSVFLSGSGFRGCRVYLSVVFIAIFLSGCASKSFRPLEKSWAIEYSVLSGENGSSVKVSSLVKSVHQQTQRHAGKSGFHFIDTGVRAFSSLSGLIEKAKRSIDLQSFLYHDDRTGRMLAYKLILAADRGVRVRILLDDFFSSSKRELLITLNAHRNIEVRFFNPVSTTVWARPLALFAKFRRVTRRMHNKTFIIDNRVAVMGGRNIGDVYFAIRKDYQFTDLDVLTVGPIVRNISGSFDLFWNSRWVVAASTYSSMNGSLAINTNLIQIKLEQLRKSYERLSNSLFMKAVSNAGIAKKLEEGDLSLMWSDAQLYFDPPEKVRAGLKNRKRYLMRQIMPHLMKAKTEILIVTPYFVPRRSGLRWIKKLRKKGIKITILTNSFATHDIPIAYIGYERYRRKVLKMGVEIYEFKPSALSKHRSSYGWLKKLPKAGLHSKLIIVDGEKIFIGSSNLNPRSRNLDTEISVMITSTEISDRMSGLFHKLIKPENSYRVVLRKRTDSWADEDSDETQLVWETKINGKVVQYKQEPNTWLYEHIGILFMGLLPIEGLL